MSDARYLKEYRLRTHCAGGALRLDAEPFRRVIQGWVDAGYTLAQIEAASGYNSDGLASILNGTRPGINPESAEKLLATRMRPDMIPDYLTTDATGTRRRLQAMNVVGHSNVAIATALGRSLHFVSDIVRERHHTVRRRYAAQVAELYERWSVISGPSARARNTAAKRGWPGPDAWDDDIDDPKAKPNAAIRLDAVGLARERSKEIRLLASAGAMPEQIAERIGMNEQSVREHLRTKHHTLYLELTA